MKLNYTSILTAATLMVAAANANAGMIMDWYAGATAGYGSMAMVIDNNDHDHTSDHAAQSYGAIIGVDLPVVRFEAEYNYLDSKRVDMQTLMGNAYVKLPGLVVVNPYIGVGVGVMFDASADSKYYPDIKLDTAIAYQGMLGATLNIPALPFKIDIEGRALFVPEIYSKYGVEVDGLQYDARIKLRYVF
jgi:hypothetical protein